MKLLNIWGRGQILSFSGIDGETDFDNGIVMRTAFDECGFDIRLPLEGGSIRFDHKKLESDNLILAGDFFVAGNLKAIFIDAWHLLLDGAFKVRPGDSVETVEAGNRILVGSKGKLCPELINHDIEELVKGRISKLESWPVPDDISIQTRKALAKAYSQLRTMFYSPTGEIKHRWTTPDRWPHRNMWLWDSVFHAIGIRHIDHDLAKEAILAVFDLQREDGFIPLCGSPGYKTVITQPPVLALGVKLVNAVSPSKAFIAESYPFLKKYLEWDLENRDTDGAGLLEWYIEEVENCRSGESGMDNSPRFDSAMQIDATDFNAFMSHECEIMAEFAAQLGFNEEACVWRKRNTQINQLINARLWNKEQNFYFDYDVSQNRMLDIMSSSGFLPLICGAATREQAEHLAHHLMSPQTFGTALPVASVACCHDNVYSKDMWRGPVWININWLIAYGFRRYGMDDSAEMILNKSIAEIEKMYLKYGTFFEFYDDRCETDPPDLLRKSRNLPDSYHQAFHDFGWTATLYIDMILVRRAGQTKAYT